MDRYERRLDRNDLLGLEPDRDHVAAEASAEALRVSDAAFRCREALEHDAAEKAERERFFAEEAEIRAAQNTSYARAAARRAATERRVA